MCVSSRESHSSGPTLGGLFVIRPHLSHRKTHCMRSESLSLWIRPSSLRETHVCLTWPLSRRAAQGVAVTDYIYVSMSHHVCGDGVTVESGHQEHVIQKLSVRFKAEVCAHTHPCLTDYTLTELLLRPTTLQRKKRHSHSQICEDERKHLEGRNGTAPV